MQGLRSVGQGLTVVADELYWLPEVKLKCSSIGDHLIYSRPMYIYKQQPCVAAVSNHGPTRSTVSVSRVQSLCGY